MEATAASGADGVSAYRAAEKAYRRDGKRPAAGLTDEQQRCLLDVDECVRRRNEIKKLRAVSF